MPAGRTTPAYDANAQPLTYEQWLALGYQPEGPPPQPAYVATDAGTHSGAGAEHPYTDTSMYSAPVENQHLAGGPSYEPPYAPPPASSPSAALHRNESFPAPTGQSAPAPNWEAWLSTLPPATGEPDAPPPARPASPVPQGDLSDAIWGGLGFLGKYATGRRNLVDDVRLHYVPYDEMQRRGGSRALIEAQASLPEWLQYTNGVLREQYFADPMANTMSPEAAAAYDRTDAYMGLDRDYLRRMTYLPTYMTPVRPLLARVAHAVRTLPSPTWEPPYLPGMEPRPGERLGDAFRESQSQSLEPNVYYDDPFIPGPDRGYPVHRG